MLKEVRLISNQTARSPKENRLSIQTSGPDKTLLSQAARLKRMNTSQFVLQASLDAARVIVADQTEFRLPAEQWEAFCRRLDEPPRIIEPLRQLFNEVEPFDT